MAKSFSYDQPYIIVGALIEHNGKFLVLQENHDPNKGLWNIPSGKLDFGESPLDGVRREAKEEAGIDLEPQYVVSIASIYRRDVGPDHTNQIHALRIIYTGRATGELSLANGEIDGAGEREIAQYRWLSPEEIKRLPLRYADLPRAIESYQANRTLPLDTIAHLVQEPTNREGH